MPRSEARPALLSHIRNAFVLVLVLVASAHSIRDWAVEPSDGDGDTALSGWLLTWSAGVPEPRTQETRVIELDGAKLSQSTQRHPPLQAVDD